MDGVQVAAARNLLEEMKARDVPRDDVVCGAAMEVFGKAGNVDEALALIEEMRRNGLEPSCESAWQIFAVFLHECGPEWSRLL